MTHDVGTGGVLFLTSSRFEVGQRVDLGFRPDPDRSSRVDVAGTVVRSEDDPYADLWRFRVAVRFDPMSRETLIRLTGILGDADVASEEDGGIGDLDDEPTRVDRELPEALAGTRVEAPTGDRVRFDTDDSGIRPVMRGLASRMPPKPRRLPRWLPENRILGGFWIERQLGRGAAGSVFIAKRVEEADDDDAPRFALKVPDAAQSPGQTLSDSEFRGLFRSEAGALLALPEHDNLAHLVSFDAGVRPKPILVMELVDGPSLESTLGQGLGSIDAAFEILDGIAAGLEAMHREGVAHLDLKPSNVIMRDSEDGRPAPVLVDFGLAGRRLRPGCGTAHYGSPEAWQAREQTDASPTPADVYSFACLAYEVLTGELLFEGSSALAVIHDHLVHDGDPLGVARLCNDPVLGPVGELLRMALRADPTLRPSIEEMRACLAEQRERLRGREWPLRRGTSLQSGAA